MFMQVPYENLHKTSVKHRNCKLCYQQLHLKHFCNLASYCLQAPWGWYNSVETCSGVIICEIIVHLLVIVQNNKRCTVHSIEIMKWGCCMLEGRYLMEREKKVISELTFDNTFVLRRIRACILWLICAPPEEIRVLLVTSAGILK